MARLIETLRSRFGKRKIPDSADYNSIDYGLKKITDLFQPGVYQVMLNEKISKEGGFRVLWTAIENRPDILINFAEEGSRLGTFTLTADIKAIKQDLNTQIFEEKRRHLSTIQTTLAVFGQNGKALNILARASSETNTTAIVASPPSVAPNS